MSISDDIRTVLRTAAGPLTCSEIRETCDEDYTAEQIGGAINGMFISGEVIRDGEGRGKFTYMLDTAFVPKRARAETETAGVPPPPKRKRKSPPPSKLAPKAKAAVAHIDSPPKPAPAIAVTSNSTVEFSRDALRRMACALICWIHEPSPELRSDVTEALRLTF